MAKPKSRAKFQTGKDRATKSQQKNLPKAVSRKARSRAQEARWAARSGPVVERKPDQTS